MPSENTIPQVIQIVQALLDHTDPALTFYVSQHLHSLENLLGPWKKPKHTVSPNHKGELLVLSRERLRGDPVVRIVATHTSAGEITQYQGWTTYPWGVAAQELHHIPGTPYARKPPKEWRTAVYNSPEPAMAEMDAHLVELGVQVINAPGPQLSPWTKDVVDDKDHVRWVRTAVNDGSIHGLIEGEPDPYTDTDGKVYVNVMHTWSLPVLGVNCFTPHHGSGKIGAASMTKKHCDRALHRLGYQLL